MSSPDEQNPEMFNDSRLWVIAALAEKLAETRELQARYAESNSRAIAALAQQVQENQKLDLELIQANSNAIRDLITSLDKLQRSQLAITQRLGEKQNLLQDFQHILQALLERNDLTSQETARKIEQISQEMLMLQCRFDQMHQDIEHLFQKLAQSSEF